jgi:hypothetical protein
MSGLVKHVAHFQRRVIQDAITEATADYWDRRAATFTAVGTPGSDHVALACRRHAWLLRDTGLDHEAHTIIEAIYQERQANL